MNDLILSTINYIIIRIIILSLKTKQDMNSDRIWTLVGGA